MKTNPFVLFSIFLIFFSACEQKKEETPDIAPGAPDPEKTTDTLWLNQGETDTIYNTVYSDDTDAGIKLRFAQLDNDLSGTFYVWEVDFSDSLASGTVPGEFAGLVDQCRYAFGITASSNALGTYLVDVDHIAYFEGSNLESPSAIATYVIRVVGDTAGGGALCRDDVVADYSVADDCAPTGFPVVDGQCSAGPGENDVTLSFELMGTAQIAASVDCNNNTLTIPSQTVNTGAQDIEIDGSGTFTITQDGATMIITYNAKIAGSSDAPTTCNATWTED